MVGIDPDGQQGVKKVDKTSVIRALRGPDSVGSQVTVKVSKHDSKELVEFALKRADYRSVEKIKDLYLKMAALGSAAAKYKEDYERHCAEARGKALGADYLKKVLTESLDDFHTIAGELEPVVHNYTDWAGVVEDSLRNHVLQLEGAVGDVFASAQREKEEHRRQRQQLDIEMAAAREKWKTDMNEAVGKLQGDLKAARDEQSALLAQLASMEKQMAAAETRHKRELEAERARQETELDRLRAEHRMELDRERRRHSEEESQLRRRFEAEFAAERLKLQEEIESQRKKLESRAAGLEDALKAAREHAAQLERAMELAKASAEKELESLRSQLATIHDEYEHKMLGREAER